MGYLDERNRKCGAGWTNSACAPAAKEGQRGASCTTAGPDSSYSSPGASLNDQGACYEAATRYPACSSSSGEAYLY